jgi:hypothetical protein
MAWTLGQDGRCQPDWSDPLPNRACVEIDRTLGRVVLMAYDARDARRWGLSSTMA